MTAITTIYSYPIPFDRDEIIKIQEEAIEDDSMHILDEEDIERSVDGFHDKYIDELIRTDEWSVFRNFWNHSDYYYFWNHQLEYGFKIDGSWEVMCAFVEMMHTFTDEFDPSDFEPTYYPWELP